MLTGASAPAATDTGPVKDVNSAAGSSVSGAGGAASPPTPSTPTTPTTPSTPATPRTPSTPSAAPLSVVLASKKRLPAAAAACAAVACTPDNDSGKSSSCSPALLDCSFDSGIGGMIGGLGAVADMQLHKRIQQCKRILLALERDENTFRLIRERLSKVSDRKNKEASAAAGAATAATVAGAVSAADGGHLCNVCCAELNLEDAKSSVKCSICQKRICRNIKCAAWQPRTAQWECELCQSSKESLAQTSSWVAEQISFNQQKLVYPMRARSEIFIPISDSTDSFMHFESVSQAGGQSTTAISAEQKLKIREYVEEVVAKLLGGSLDHIRVGQMSKSENYLPSLAKGQNGSVVSATSAASADSGAARNATNDFSDLSQTRLRQLIQTIIAETMHVPASLPAHAVSEVALDTRSKTAHTLPLTNGHRHRTEHYFEPKIYQDLLATAVLNKIVDSQQANVRALSESTPELSRMAAADQNFNAEDHSVSSGSSVEPRSDCSYTDVEQMLHANSNGESPTPLGSVRDLNTENSFGLHFDAGRQSVMSDYIAAHMVPLPDLSAPATESDEDEYTSVASSAVGEGTWEDNWLFKKKRATLSSSVSAASAGMLVPAPREDVRAQIGDKTADEVSDLSEMGSDADDSSLDSLHTKLDPLNDRLLNKHLIGGQNTKMVLDELIESAASVKNEATYAEARNEHIADHPSPQTEAINRSVQKPPQADATSGDPPLLQPPAGFEDPTTKVDSTPLTAAADHLGGQAKASRGHGSVRCFESAGRPSSVIELIAALTLGPLLAVSGSDHSTVPTPIVTATLKDLKDLAITEINTRPLDYHNLDVIHEEASDSDLQKDLLFDLKNIPTPEELPEGFSFSDLAIITTTVRTAEHTAGQEGTLITATLPTVKEPSAAPETPSVPSTAMNLSETPTPQDVSTERTEPLRLPVVEELVFETVIEPTESVGEVEMPGPATGSASAEATFVAVAVAAETATEEVAARSSGQEVMPPDPPILNISSDMEGGTEISFLQPVGGIEISTVTPLEDTEDSTIERVEQEESPVAEAKISESQFGAVEVVASSDETTQTESVGIGTMAFEPMAEPLKDTVLDHPVTSEATLAVNLLAPSPEKLSTISMDADIKALTRVPVPVGPTSAASGSDSSNEELDPAPSEQIVTEAQVHENPAKGGEDEMIQETSIEDTKSMLAKELEKTATPATEVIVSTADTKEEESSLKLAEEEVMKSQQGVDGPTSKMDAESVETLDEIFQTAEAELSITSNVESVRYESNHAPVKQRNDQIEEVIKATCDFDECTTILSAMDTIATVMEGIVKSEKETDPSMETLAVDISSEESVVGPLVAPSEDRPPTVSIGDGITLAPAEEARTVESELAPKKRTATAETPIAEATARESGPEAAPERVAALPKILLLKSSLFESTTPTMESEVPVLAPIDETKAESRPVTSVTVYEAPRHLAVETIPLTAEIDPPVGGPSFLLPEQGTAQSCDAETKFLIKEAVAVDTESIATSPQSLDLPTGTGISIDALPEQLVLKSQDIEGSTPNLEVALTAEKIAVSLVETATPASIADESITESNTSPEQTSPHTIDIDVVPTAEEDPVTVEALPSFPEIPENPTEQILKGVMSVEGITAVDDESDRVISVSEADTAEAEPSHTPIKAIVSALASGSKISLQNEMKAKTPSTEILRTVINPLETASTRETLRDTESSQTPSELLEGVIDCHVILTKSPAGRKETSIADCDLTTKTVTAPDATSQEKTTSEVIMPSSEPTQESPELRKTVLSEHAEASKEATAAAEMIASLVQSTLGSTPATGNEVSLATPAVDIVNEITEHKKVPAEISSAQTLSIESITFPLESYPTHVSTETRETTFEAIALESTQIPSEQTNMECTSTERTISTVTGELTNPTEEEIVTEGPSVDSRIPAAKVELTTATEEETIIESSSKESAISTADVELTNATEEETVTEGPSIETSIPTTNEEITTATEEEPVTEGPSEESGFPATKVEVTTATEEETVIESSSKEGAIPTLGVEPTMVQRPKLNHSSSIERAILTTKVKLTTAIGEETAAERPSVESAIPATKEELTTATEEETVTKDSSKESATKGELTNATERETVKEGSIESAIRTGKIKLINATEEEIATTKLEHTTIIEEETVTEDPSKESTISTAKVKLTNATEENTITEGPSKEITTSTAEANAVTEDPSIGNAILSITEELTSATEEITDVESSSIESAVPATKLELNTSSEEKTFAGRPSIKSAIPVNKEELTNATEEGTVAKGPSMESAILATEVELTNPTEEEAVEEGSSLESIITTSKVEQNTTSEEETLTETPSVLPNATEDETVHEDSSTESALSTTKVELTNATKEEIVTEAPSMENAIPATKLELITATEEETVMETYSIESTIPATKLDLTSPTEEETVIEVPPEQETTAEEPIIARCSTSFPGTEQPSREAIKSIGSTTTAEMTPATTSSLARPKGQVYETTLVGRSSPVREAKPVEGPIETMEVLDGATTPSTGATEAQPESTATIDVFMEGNDSETDPLIVQRGLFEQKDGSHDAVEDITVTMESHGASSVLQPNETITTEFPIAENTTIIAEIDYIVADEAIVLLEDISREAPTSEDVTLAVEVVLTTTGPYVPHSRDKITEEWSGEATEAKVPLTPTEVTESTVEGVIPNAEQPLLGEDPSPEKKTEHIVPKANIIESTAPIMGLVTKNAGSIEDTENSIDIVTSTTGAYGVVSEPIHGANSESGNNTLSPRRSKEVSGGEGDTVIAVEGADTSAMLSLHFVEKTAVNGEETLATKEAVLPSEPTVVTPEINLIDTCAPTSENGILITRPLVTLAQQRDLETPDNIVPPEDTEPVLVATKELETAVEAIISTSEDVASTTDNDSVNKVKDTVTSAKELTVALLDQNATEAIATSSAAISLESSDKPTEPNTELPEQTVTQIAKLEDVVEVEEAKAPIEPPEIKETMMQNGTTAAQPQVLGTQIEVAPSGTIDLEIFVESVNPVEGMGIILAPAEKIEDTEDETSTGFTEPVPPVMKRTETQSQMDTEDPASTADTESAVTQAKEGGTSMPARQPVAELLIVDDAIVEETIKEAPTGLIDPPITTASASKVVALQEKNPSGTFESASTTQTVPGSATLMGILDKTPTSPPQVVESTLGLGPALPEQPHEEELGAGRISPISGAESLPVEMKNTEILDESESVTVEEVPQTAQTGEVLPESRVKGTFVAEKIASASQALEDPLASTTKVAESSTELPEQVVPQIPLAESVISSEPISARAPKGFEVFSEPNPTSDGESVAEELAASEPDVAAPDADKALSEQTIAEASVSEGSTALPETVAESIPSAMESGVALEQQLVAEAELPETTAVLSEKMESGTVEPDTVQPNAVTVEAALIGKPPEGVAEIGIVGPTTKGRVESPVVENVEPNTEPVGEDLTEKDPVQVQGDPETIETIDADANTDTKTGFDEKSVIPTEKKAAPDANTSDSSPSQWATDTTQVPVAETVPLETTKGVERTSQTDTSPARVADGETDASPASGSIAEREYMKWYNAVEMPNNPYAPEALRKRITSGSQERFIDLPNISPTCGQTPVRLMQKDDLAANEANRENDYKRYRRDYYINDDDRHAASSSSDGHHHHPKPADDSNSAPNNSNSSNSNNNSNIIINEPPQPPPETAAETYQALPVLVKGPEDSASLESNSLRSANTSTSDDSDTVRIYDFRKQKTTTIERDTKPVEPEKPPPPVEQRRRSAPSPIRTAAAVAPVAATRGCTPTAFKFLQPKRKLIEPSEVLSLDEDEPAKAIVAKPLERPVIEKEVVKALPSVKALARAFLLTSSIKSTTWPRKAEAVVEVKKEALNPAPVKLEEPSPSPADVAEDATIASDLSSLETDPSGYKEAETTKDFQPNASAPDAATGPKTSPTKPGCLKSNIAFFENLKFK